MTMTSSNRVASAGRTAVSAFTQRTGSVATVRSFESPVQTSFPTSLAADEVYYWTAKWQADETESRRELEDGRGRTFETSADAIRWLLDPTAE
jgi:hypothetical protein